VVLRGNLAPRGAIIKASASKDRRLLSHTGPAVVFKNSADLGLRIDSPDLDVTKDSVLVLQAIGPIGNPGMPEAGMIQLPRKLAALGVTDMLRVSDGRMSGTAGGTIVLHVSPEAAIPTSVLGTIKDGDTITCDIKRRVLNVDLSQDEIDQRLAERALNDERTARTDCQSKRGYAGLYQRSVNQAEEGADFDFLTAAGPKR
jgi:dihydroxy-acid dehydratase